MSISSSGTALPAPSASRIGRPFFAPAYIGTIVLNAPVSTGIKQSIFEPIVLSSNSKALIDSISKPFSNRAFGAPIPATVAIFSLPLSSSTVINIGSMFNTLICSANFNPDFIEPPPPAPRSAEPLIISSIFLCVNLLILYPPHSNLLFIEIKQSNKIIYNIIQHRYKFFFIGHTTIFFLLNFFYNL
ncbi:hypothetical protein ES705_16491 [subsurface metagenome]